MAKTKAKKIKKTIEVHLPLLHRVLVKVECSEEVKRVRNSPIAIPETSNYVDRESAAVDVGIIVDIGLTAFEGFGGEERLKIGDRVTFLRHAGAIRKINDEDHRVLNDVDLLTKIITKEIEVEEV